MQSSTSSDHKRHNTEFPALRRLPLFLFGFLKNSFELWRKNFKKVHYLWAILKKWVWRQTVLFLLNTAWLTTILFLSFCGKLRTFLSETFFRMEYPIFQKVCSGRSRSDPMMTLPYLNSKYISVFRQIRTYFLFAFWEITISPSEPFFRDWKLFYLLLNRKGRAATKKGIIIYADWIKHFW